MQQPNSMKRGILTNWLFKLSESVERQTHLKLANALAKQGDLSAAIDSYNNAIKLKPDSPDAHNDLGNTLMKQGDLIAAIASYSTALQLKPNHPEVNYNIGLAFKAQGDLFSAIKFFKNSIKFRPNFPSAYNDLGNALIGQGDVATAITCYQTAIELKPDFADAHKNLGVAYKCKGDLHKATRLYDTALKLRPNFPDAEFNLSTVMLLHGDYINGLEKYESRSRREQSPGKPHASPKCELWSDTSLKRNTEVLLIAEQGYGDTIQFMRYALALRERGINTSLCAQPKLHSLIRASGIDPSPLTPDEANQVNDGYWIPLLSLPKYLEVSPNNPIITEPYIQTTDELLAKWETKLSAEKRPIIGINWQGNPLVEQSILRGRSWPLETFAPIADQTNTTLLSLQKDFGSEQLETCSFKDRFVSCQDQVNETWDFLETAAIIANCDLIITSDTAIAHLAGGMGKTTWLLLQKIPEWRWGLEGESTFWYPTMRLFRQTERGNWDEVMQRVKLALQTQFGTRSTPQKSPKTSMPSNQSNPIQKPPINFFHDYRNSIFKSHAHFALERYLNPLYKAISNDSNFDSNSLNPDRQILLADNRPSPLLRFCVLNSLLMTSFKYKCLIYTDASNIDAMRGLFSDLGNFIEIGNLSIFNIAKLNRASYNNLLKNSRFWEKLTARSVLVTQQDALMIEPLPDDYFKYDYIGAPWNPKRTFSISFPKYSANNLKECSEDWTNLVMNPNLDLPTKIGNGGHSIRSVEYMTAISSTYFSEENEPEDVFYARNSQHYSGHFPSISEAKKFCCETSYSFSHSSHASHLYLDARHQAEIYERHIKHLAALYSANCT